MTWPAPSSTAWLAWPAGQSATAGGTHGTRGASRSAQGGGRGAGTGHNVAQVVAEAAPARAQAAAKDAEARATVDVVVTELATGHSLLHVLQHHSTVPLAAIVCSMAARVDDTALLPVGIGVPSMSGGLPWATAWARQAPLVAGTWVGKGAICLQTLETVGWEMPYISAARAWEMLWPSSTRVSSTCCLTPRR